MISSLLFACLAGLVSPILAADCTRESLKEGTADYLDALTAGSSTFLALSTSKVHYEENHVEQDIAKGVLSTPIKIDYNLSIYDTTLCASYTEVVATTGHPYVIGTRLEFSGSPQKITKIESVVLDQGDWLFNATGSLLYNQREAAAGGWASIPLGQRDSREVLKAAGDAYVDAWSDANIKPPFATNCARLEGGLYITSNCLLSFPPPFEVTKRSYTIDEELGAVDIFHNFPFLDASLPRNPGTQTNNLIRVEGGKIRFIHENTVCQAKNCGR
ncbi:hypothetical protein QBC38DRAFT_364936 [Podospora fimiseda]|uniref:DUF8021 domain-containing protein n=1 Tax=Podospora fimiseda TaxID=252190 RepID=A0AAN7BPI0_9PEZI|nr:hypothetical protein QBC38DRAFT_364936 [Podospora fimiseda]